MSDAAVESAVKDMKPKAGSDHVTAEVITAAMQGNKIDTRAARQSLTLALEANGTLPSLVLDDFNHHQSNGVMTVAQLRERAAGDPSSGETLTAQAILDRIEEIDGNHNGTIDQTEINTWAQAQAQIEHRADGTSVRRDASGNPVEVSAPNGDHTQYRYGADGTIDISRTNRLDHAHDEKLHFENGKWTRQDATGTTYSVTDVVQTQDGYQYTDKDGRHFQNNNGDHTLTKQDGTKVITQKNANGSVEYNYPPTDSSEPVKITWLEPSGKPREELHQDRTGPTAGQWFRTYTNPKDGQRVTESVTNVAQTPDGYTYTDSTGNRIDQNKSGERQLSKPNGDYVIFDATGKPAQIFHQSNGNHETLFKKDDGTWWRQSGRSGEAHSLESISSVIVNADGSYSFQSRDGKRYTEQKADGKRVDEDISKGTKTKYTWNADGSLKMVESVNPDNSKETLVRDGDRWTVSKNGGEAVPVRAEVDPLNGRYQYQLQDGSGAIRNADGSRVEVAVVARDGDKNVIKPVAVTRPDGVRYAIKYDKGIMSEIELHIPGKPGEGDSGNTSPERVDKWLPTDKPGEMRRSDGVVATNLEYNASGDFSFVYVNHLGIKVKHTDQANGTQSDEPA